MDDQEFDDILKNKIGDYQYPDFDEDALAAFRARMAVEAPNPWYIRYRSEIMTAAASLFLAALFLWGQSRYYGNSIEYLSDQIGQLKSQNEKLQEGLAALAEGPDTVRLVEYRESSESIASIRALRSQILGLQAQLESSRAVKTSGVPNNHQLVYAGTRATLPDDVLDYLQKEHQLVQNGEYYFLLVDQSLLENDVPAYLEPKNSIASHYRLPEYTLVLDSIETTSDIEHVTTTRTHEVRLPVRQIREIEENQYSSGIGIEAGPAAEIYRTIYSSGKGEAAFGGGLLVNFITSPHLSFETGALFNTSEYLIGAMELTEFNLPEADPTYGNFRGVDVTSWFLEFPVNLKYRYRISATNHLVGGIGLSSLLYTKQEFEYLYNYDIGGDFIVPVEKHLRKKEPLFQLGTANLSLGVSSSLKNGKRLETLVFYKRSVGEIGFEEADAQFLGIRASYMFTVK